MSRARRLPEVAAAAKRGELPAQDLLDCFMGARVYSPAPPRPGVHVMEIGGERVVPVFSSEAELARFVGQGEWFSTTGADLLTLLPTGVVLGLDLASPHRVRLDPAATELERVLYLRLSRPGSTGS